MGCVFFPALGCGCLNVFNSAYPFAFGFTQHQFFGVAERRAGEYLKRIANGQPSIAQPALAPVVSGQSASMFMISVPEVAKAKADMLFNMLRNIGCEIVDF